MTISMEVFQGSVLAERYTVPDGSWLQTKTLGAQYAFPVLNKEVTYKNDKGHVVCSPVEPIPDIPETLLDLVNSSDESLGKNGCEWMGKNREHQGGTETDRVREYVRQAVYHNFNPLCIDEHTLSELLNKL